MSEETVNETKTARPKQSSARRKLLFVLLFIIIAIIWIGFLHTPSSTVKYDKLDDASYAVFTKQTTAEANNSIDQNLDAFLEEITSLTSMRNAVTDFLHITNNEKEKFVSQQWRKHISDPIDGIVTARVKMLVDDMYRNNNECMETLRTTGVNVQGFERKIRDDLVDSMASEGIRISSGAVDGSMINSAIAFGVGATAASATTLLKSNWYTFALGLIIDLAVSGVVDNKLNGDLKNDLKRQIKTALDDALDGKNGLYARIKQGIDKFHAERAAQIRQAG